MAFRIEPGTRHDGIDLMAQIRNRVDRTGVDGRREQPDDPKFPDELAVGAEQFHADIIHVDAAMHPCAHR